MKPHQWSAATLSLLASNFVYAEADIFNEVVVTANKYEENLSQTAGSVAVINTDDVREEGATELYDVLTHEPGVNVTGGAGRPQNITIRGMSGNRVAIIKDGISTSDGFGADDLNDSAGRNSFDISTLKKIQVVKGASSTSYGSGAIGGVVILSSYTPEDLLGSKDFYSDISTTYTGISNKYRISSNVAFRTESTSSLFSVGYWSGNESRNYQSDLYNRDVEGTSFEYTLHHYLSDQWLLKAKAEIYNEKMNTLEGSSSLQPDGIWSIGDYNEETSTTTYLAWIGAEYDADHIWMDSLDTKVYYRFSEYKEGTNRLMNRENNGVTELRREIDNREFNDQLFGFSMDFDKEIYSKGLTHTIVYGGVAETSYHDRPVHDTTSDWNGTTSSNSAPFAPARSYSLGVFLQDSISMGAWTTMLGLRFDAHKLMAEKNTSAEFYDLKDNSSHELSPSASLTYQFTNELNAYVSYKHGYRAPEYDKTYGYVSHEFVPITPFVILPNFNLEAETSDSFELGSKYDSGSLRIYTAIFYNKFENFISVVDQGFNSSTGLFEKKFDNFNGVETYGAELSIEYAFNSSWSALGKAGWVDGEDGNGEYVRTITPLEGNFTLNYTKDIFNSYARVNWAGSMDRTPSCATELGLQTTCATTSGWATFDMGVGVEMVKDLSINLNILNLFDREYTRYQDVAGVSSSQTHFSTQPGRYFTVNARYAF